MDAGGIQWIVPVQDAHESGALFECLGPQLGHLQQLSPVGEASVGLPVVNDVAGNGLVDSGDIFQKGRGCGVQIHAHFVHAVLHHAVQGIAELLLVHVMLVLAYADGLGVDFHQLRQRILEPAGDGRGASLSHIEIGEFLGGQLAGGINAGPGFVYDDILYRPVQLFQQIHDNLFGFPGGGAIAHGNQIHMVFRNQLLQLPLGLLHLILGGGGINHFRIQHFTGRVNNGQLAASAEGGIPSQHHLSGDGGRKQQLFQVLAEHIDSAVLRLFRQVIPYFPFDGRRNQALVAVLYGFLQQRECIRVLRGDCLLDQIPQNPLHRGIDFHGQHFLRFSPVQRKHSVPRHFPHRLLKIIVHLVYACGLLILGGAGDDALLHGGLADVAAVVRVVGDALSDDVLRSLYRFFRRPDSLLFLCVLSGDIFCSLLHDRSLGFLGQDILCQAVQPFGLGHAGAGLALRPIGAIEVFHYHQGLGCQNLLLQLFCQLPLLLDAAQNLLLLLFQIAQVGQPLVQVTELLVVQGTGGLLSVS